MFSFLVGGAVGFWVQHAKVGLAQVLLYSFVAGVVLANVSYREAAGFMPLLFSLTGFGIGRLAQWFRSNRKYSREDVPAASKSSLTQGAPTSITPSAVPSNADDRRDELYSAASLAHAAFLSSLGRELDDLQFTATAFGTFDGTVQALGVLPSDIDMLAKGSTFVLRQISELERMKDASPSAKGDLIGLAMTAPVLEAVRARAGQFAFDNVTGSTIKGAAAC